MYPRIIWLNSSDEWEIISIEHIELNDIYGWRINKYNNKISVWLVISQLSIIRYKIYSWVKNTMKDFPQLIVWTSPEEGGLLRNMLLILLSIKMYLWIYSEYSHCKKGEKHQVFIIWPTLIRRETVEGTVTSLLLAIWKDSKIKDCALSK